MFRLGTVTNGRAILTHLGISEVLVGLLGASNKRVTMQSSGEVAKGKAGI